MATGKFCKVLTGKIATRHNCQLAKLPRGKYVTWHIFQLPNLSGKKVNWQNFQLAKCSTSKMIHWQMVNWPIVNWQNGQSANCPLSKWSTDIVVTWQNGHGKELNGKVSRGTFFTW